jgi:hypothetical protein
LCENINPVHMLGQSEICSQVYTAPKPIGFH